jgi:hypothetical protein
MFLTTLKTKSRFHSHSHNHFHPPNPNYVVDQHLFLKFVKQPHPSPFLILLKISFFCLNSKHTVSGQSSGDAYSRFGKQGSSGKIVHDVPH